MRSVSPAPRVAPWLIAHRGLAARELYRAQDMVTLALQGATAVEVAVRVNDPGELVARHSPLPAARGGADHGFLTDIVPAAFAAGLGVYLDVKAMTATGATRLARLLAGHEGAAIVASASPRLVRMIRAALPDATASVLYRTPVPAPVRLSTRAGVPLVHPCWEWLRRPDMLLTRRHGAALHRAGVDVVTWHEERPRVLEGLLRSQLPLRGICTDDVPLLASIARQLQQR